MVQYRKDNLPIPAEGMPLHRKTALTPMVHVEGPVSFVTQEGEYELPEGWKGYCAVDKEGYPYPVSDENYNSSYEAASKDQDTKAVGFDDRQHSYERQLALDLAIRIETADVKSADCDRVLKSAQTILDFINKS